MRVTLRSASCFIGLASLLVPATYVFVQGRAFEAWSKTQGGVVCGMPLLAIWFLALVASALLSILAVLVNYASLVRQRGASSPARFIELGVLALPFLVAVAAIFLALLGHA